MKLTAEAIVDAGMATFAEVGYQGLSMRRVAERVDAHAGSLYYHVRNKDALLQLMADRVARQAYDAGTEALSQLPGDATWQQRIEAQSVALRTAIRQHPGGAILLADSPKVLSAGALSLMERLQETLRDAGVPAAHRGIAADTLLSYITGFVLQEQGEAQLPAVGPQDVADLRARFPMAMAGGAQGDEDEKFRVSVALLCSAFAQLVG